MFAPRADSVIQKKKKLPTCDVTNKKTNPKLNIFLVETRRLPESVEGLNSSLALATGDLWPEMCRPS